MPMQTTSIESKLRDFVEETYLFGQPDGLEDDASFLDRGIIDSTGILELIAFVQETYGIQVEDEDAVPANLDSISRIAAYIRRKLEHAGINCPAQGVEGRI